MLLLLLACTDPGTTRRPGEVADSGEPAVDSGEVADSGGDSAADSGEASPCPADMELVGTACMDRYEAPNRAGATPLVMYHLYEAEAWCDARGKRLCYDDEWLAACEGAAASAYPYGDAHEPGRCNDEEIWRVYSQSKLNGWPSGAARPDIESVDELLDAARALGATVAADHVAELYQGEGGGANAGCTNETGVYDLQGNVEEWTLRRDGGDGGEFTGNLKGRYWAEVRTCQSNVTTHGNAFRFYEIGFRCCRDAD